ncbi:MAG: glycosyltransferase family 39 protein [Bacteroidia bacterium]
MAQRLSITAAYQSLIRWNERVFDWIARNPITFLLAVMLLGALTRFIYLGAPSFYLDEAFSVFHGQKRLGLLLESVAKDTNPPLHFILLKYWMELTGKSEVSTRLLSALFSIASIPMIFVIGRRFFNLRIGALAAVFLAVSDIHVVYSGEARTYTLVSFLVLVSTYFFLALCESGKWKHAIGLGITNTLLIHAHYGVYIFFLIQLLAVFILAGKRWTVLRGYFASQVGAVLLFLPWLIYWTQHFVKPKDWASPPDQDMFYYVVLRFAGLEWILYFQTAVLALGLVIGLVQLLRKRLEQPVRWAFLWLWGGVSLVLAFWLSHWVLPVFQPNYLMYASLGLILLVAWTWDAIPFLKNVSAFTAAILCFFLLQDLHFNYGKPFAWRSAVSTVKLLDTPETLKIYLYNFNEPIFAYYYDRNAFVNYRHTAEMLTAAHAHGVNAVEDLAQFHPGEYNRVIFSHLRTDRPDLTAAVQGQLEGIFGKPQTYGDWEMTVDLYERDSLR